MTSPRLLRSFGTCLLAASLAFVAGCGERPTPASAKPAAPTESGAPSGKPLAGGVAFVPFDAETFARAKREGKLVLLDGAAEWCHFCHVMGARTYHDPRVMKLLTERFVTARVDIDARPDIQERYADYGWPATILFDAEGHELAAYRGFPPAERMLEVLGAAVGSRDRLEGSRVAAPREGGGALGAAALAREIPAVEAKLDTFYDAREGGFGTYKMIEQIKRRGWSLTMITNLVAADADRLAESGVDQLLVGVQGVSPKSYTAFHPGWTEAHFFTLCAVLRRLAQSPVRVRHVQVINRDTAPERLVQLLAPGPDASLRAAGRGGPHRRAPRPTPCHDGAPAGGDR